MSKGEPQDHDAASSRSRRSCAADSVSPRLTAAYSVLRCEAVDPGQSRTEARTTQGTGLPPTPRLGYGELSATSAHLRIAALLGGPTEFASREVPTSRIQHSGPPECGATGY